MPWWKTGITSFGSQKYSEEMKQAVRILPSEETEGFFIVKIHIIKRLKKALNIIRTKTKMKNIKNNTQKKNLHGAYTEF